MLEGIEQRQVKKLAAAARMQNKSLLMTFFGDFIWQRGGRISMAGLIQTAALFGMSSRNVRTAMLRLSREGWLESRRCGRYSDYLLSDGYRQRFMTAEQRVYAKNGADWNGKWQIALIGLLPKEKLHQLRQALIWSGFAGAGGAALIKPGFAPQKLLAELGIEKQVVLLTAHKNTSPALANLVAGSGKLRDIEEQYRQFLKFAAPLREWSAARVYSPAAAFALRTLLIHKYRRALLRDPQLPEQLLPNDWHGKEAREECAALYKKLSVTADRYADRLRCASGEPLPPPTAAYYRRFGGLPKKEKP